MSLRRQLTSGRAGRVPCFTRPKFEFAVSE
jgi:hypothetical protein